MKKSLLLIIYFLAYTSAQTQTLYGLTTNGGNDGVGTFIKFMAGTNNLTVTKSFEYLAKYPQFTNFIQATNGKLYGMAHDGGNGNLRNGDGGGVIFSFDPSTSTYTKLKNFEVTDGFIPSGSLIQASNEKLYGMTGSGGINAAGVIFSFDLSTSTYTMLHDFANADGFHPLGSLLQANNGKLYGMTSEGGSVNSGVIFSFDLSSSTYTRLINFGGPYGTNPYGSLIQAGNGKLYGMTKGGGTNGMGVIFSFDPSTSTYTKLKDFDFTIGTNPYGSLMQASDGKLYGMTTYGGSSNSYGGSSNGVIFSFDPSTSVYTKLKDFDGPNGCRPGGDLMQASDGKLYGMTHEGGNGNSMYIYGGGVIFSFDPSTSTYTKVKDFDGTNGNFPLGKPYTGKQWKNL
ncbi:hypothetical protein BH10BAC3_BH10BAC3_17460 [soil metagenome]